MDDIRYWKRDTVIFYFPIINLYTFKLMKILHHFFYYFYKQKVCSTFGQGAELQKTRNVKISMRNVKIRT